MSEPVLTDIESFLTDTGMGASYFGVKAAGNSELVGRLRQGKTLTAHTERAVRAYIAAERQRRGLPAPDHPLPAPAGIASEQRDSAGGH